MNIQNVDTFRGFNVVNGYVEVSEEMYANYIDDCHEPVVVAGITFDASKVLQECDPIAFRCGLSEEQSRVQSELEEAIDNEDDSDIEWLDEE